MMPAAHVTWLLPLEDHSQIGDARRRITVQAMELGFDETRCAAIGVVVSEMATNVLLHAKIGYLLVRRLEEVGGLEVMAVDRGRGMENVTQCLRDGFSTAGTAGNGLGAIRRMCDCFDIYSRSDHGTIVLARFHRRDPVADARFTVGAVCVALAGEMACGDMWATQATANGLRVVIADGLGHGVEAARAASNALQVVETNGTLPATELLELANRGIASTVGAAMAICDIDVTNRSARYTGIGNIAGVISTHEKQRGMVSHNGIVGHHMRKAREFTYPWQPESSLTMHSDGLLTPWGFDFLPGLQARHPSLIAAALHRDFSRGRDDVTVVVARGN